MANERGCNMGLDLLPEISTIQELAKFLKLSDTTIRRAIKSGDLKVLRAGKKIRIEKEAVLEWLQGK